MSRCDAAITCAVDGDRLGLLPPTSLDIPKLQIPTPEFPSSDERGDEDEMMVASPVEPNSPLAALRDAPADHVASRVQGGPGAGFPNPDDYYPSAARRAEEQGIATVRVCVDPRGRLTADPEMVQSSGSPRLDVGAIALAKGGSGHYRATTEDGHPVDSCYSFRVRFKLRN